MSIDNDNDNSRRVQRIDENALSAAAWILEEDYLEDPSAITYDDLPPLTFRPQTFPGETFLKAEDATRWLLASTSLREMAIHTIESFRVVAEGGDPSEAMEPLIERMAQHHGEVVDAIAARFNARPYDEPAMVEELRDWLETVGRPAVLALVARHRRAPFADLDEAFEWVQVNWARQTPKYRMPGYLLARRTANDAIVGWMDNGGLPPLDDLNAAIATS